ncbi:MAG: hypothetical protein ACOZF0_14080 [Thermodesulfobacteriota bacterium]
MSRIAIAGIISCLFGFMALGYQAIQSVMTPKSVYKTLHMIDLFNMDFIDRMDTIGWYGMQRGADWFLDLPIYLVCFVIGGVLLVISSFFWRR